VNLRLPILAVTVALFAIHARAAESPGGNGDGPPIDITCAGIIAPAVVHVRCAVPKDGNLTPLDYRYEWDFGDSAGRWNTLPGWNAAHVYDRPGQYTITLTVRGADGKETRRTTWVRVAPDDRRRVYVSAEGNDGADGATPLRAVRTVPRAFHLAKENAWVLFRRGDTFDIAAPVTLSGRNLRVGNYSGRDPSDWSGAHAKPAAVFAEPPAPLPILRKVQGPAKAESMFVHQSKAEDTLFDGIEFDSIWDYKSEFNVKKVPAWGFTVGGINFAVRNCSFRNLTDAINTALRPTGVLVQDNHFSKEIRGYCCYANGSDHVYIGNVMLHSHQEHLIRATEPGVTRILIAYNELSRPNKIKGCIELRMASWFTVAGNYIHNGTLRVGPQEQDKGQFPLWKEYKCEWGIIQDNRLEQLFLNVRLGTYHVIFRNNVIRIDAKPGAARPEDGDWAMIVECEKPGYDDVRKIQDLRIEHNTILNLAGHGYLLFLHGKPMSMTLRNNVYITGNQPGTAGGIYTTSAELSGVDVQNNVYPANRGGTHFIAKQPFDHVGWQRGVGKNERFGAVPFDADDNVPLETGAGAKLGGDRHDREARRAKEAPK
jgi:hypothetical protein